MSGHQSALIKLIVFFSLCFPQVCISKTLNSGRQKRYTKDDICLESKRTLEKVTICPTNDTAYKERSEKKNCNTLSTCAGVSVLFYHCVMSDSKLIEVCAPRTLITGRCCPFYNDKLGRVMEDFNKPCKECPFQYTSDQYVFNSECVDTGIKYDPSEHTANNNMTVRTPIDIFGDNNPEPGIEKNEEPIVIAYLLATGMIILVLVFTYCFRHRFTTIWDK